MLGGTAKVTLVTKCSGHPQNHHSDGAHSHHLTGFQKVSLEHNPGPSLTFRPKSVSSPPELSPNTQKVKQKKNFLNNEKSDRNWKARVLPLNAHARNLIPNMTVFGVGGL